MKRIGPSLACALGASWIASLPSQAAAGKPIDPGRYCLKQKLMGDTGRKGEDIDLGDMLMLVDVTKANAGYSVYFFIHWPDRQQDLEATSHRVGLLPGGILSFSFRDNWDGLGRGRLRPDGRISLTPIKQGRDKGGSQYGSYRVNRKDCAAQEFRDLNPP